MKRVAITLVGVTPCVQHNSQTADPMNPYSKELKKLTSKRVKTEDDLALLSRIEWEASMYLDAQSRPVWPAANLRCLAWKAAKKQKAGPKCKSGLTIETLEAVIQHTGPKKLDELYEKGFYDRRVVTVNGAKIVRVRAKILMPWSVQFDAIIDPTQCTEDDVLQWFEIAGAQIGLGDIPVPMGRFTVEMKARK